MILYKYLQAERVSILHDGLIRFTQPSDLNDDYDGTVEFTLAYDDRSVELALKMAKELDTAQKLARQVGIKKFSDDALVFLRKERFDRVCERHRGTVTAISDVSSNFIDALLEIMDEYAAQLLLERSIALSKEHQNMWRDIGVGVLSLSDSWSSQEMWAYYADSNRGFVIGISSESPALRCDAFDLSGPPKPVTYSASIFEVAGLNWDGLSNSYLHKSSRWAHEQEWRSVRQLRHATKIVPKDPHPIHLFQLEAESIVEIVLGLHAPPALRDEVMKLVARSFPNCQVYQACLQPETFSIARKKLQ